MSPTDIKFLPITSIEATAGTQARVSLSQETIDEYARLIKEGVILPPIKVFTEKGSERHILADGFHTLKASAKAGLTKIAVNQEEGTMHDALIYALGANHDHGLPRSRADKRNAVLMALKDPEVSELSNRKVAEICRVSKDLVRTIKEEKAEKKKQKPAPKPPTKPDPAKQESASQSSPSVRPHRELSQNQKDKTELLGACSFIRAFPYNGTEAAKKMTLSEDEVKHVDYCLEWLDDFMVELQGE